MTRRNTPLEVEQVEQLALIARLLPHHGESPSLISQADGITVRQFSRALFQHGVIPGSSQTKARESALQERIGPASCGPATMESGNGALCRTGRVVKAD